LEQAEKGYAGERKTHRRERVKGNLLSGVGGLCSDQDSQALARFVGAGSDGMVRTREKRASGLFFRTGWVS
jgi:hypothetical protein